MHETIGSISSTGEREEKEEGEEEGNEEGRKEG
jgi:hypothetical protein